MFRADGWFVAVLVLIVASAVVVGAYLATSRDPVYVATPPSFAESTGGPADQGAHQEPRPIATVPDRRPAPPPKERAADLAWTAPATSFVVSVAVVDGRSSPVAGAVVELRELHPSDSLLAVSASLASEVTGTEGRAVFRDVVRRGERYAVRARHPDLGSAIVTSLESLRPESLAVTLVLGGPARIVGSVVDFARAPVVGAQVVVYNAEINAPEAQGLEERSVVTNPDGRFEVTGLGFGAKRVSVRHRGFKSAVRSVAVTPEGTAPASIDIVLGSGVVLRGRVEEAETREPLAGVNLFLRAATLAERVAPVESVPGTTAVRTAPTAPSPRLEDPALGTETTTSNPDGSFVFEGVEEGRLYVLTPATTSPGLAPSMNVRGGAEDAVLRLRVGGLLEGVVVDATTGEPVGSATVALSRSANPLGVPWSRRARVDIKTGSFSLRDVEPGLHFIVASAPGLGRGVAGPFRLGFGERMPGIVLRLVRGATLSGRVVGSDGRPVADARVRVEEQRPAPAGALDEALRPLVAGRSAGVRTFEDGSFVVPDLTAATYRVVVVAAGSARHATEVQVVGEGRVDLGDLVLESGGTIEGVVLDKAGNSDPMAIVRLGGVDGNDRVETAAVDAFGRFAFSGLRAGTWRVLVVQRKARIIAFPTSSLGDEGHLVQLRPGETKSIELREE